MEFANPDAISASPPNSEPDHPIARQFRASDGYAMRVHRWKAHRVKPLGYLAFLHGIQSHAGWYAASCRQLCEAGYDVRFLDRRGSGANDRDRGHAIHGDRLVSDAVDWLQTIRHERDTAAPAAPVVLAGISWGGKLAVMAGSRRPNLADGIALLCPGLTPRIRPNIFQKWLLRLAMRAGKSRRLVPIPLSDPAFFTDDPKWQDFIRNDPLALHQATVGLLSASIYFDAAIPAAMERLSIPALLMLAGRDRIIDNEKSRRIWHRGETDRRTLIEYPEACHTLEFDVAREQSVCDLISWIEGIRPNPPVC